MPDINNITVSAIYIHQGIRFSRLQDRSHHTTFSQPTHMWSLTMEYKNALFSATPSKSVTAGIPSSFMGSRGVMIRTIKLMGHAIPGPTCGPPVLLTRFVNDLLKPSDTKTTWTYRFSTGPYRVIRILSGHDGSSGVAGMFIFAVVQQEKLFYP